VKLGDEMEGQGDEYGAADQVAHRGDRDVGEKSVSTPAPRQQGLRRERRRAGRALLTGNDFRDLLGDRCADLSLIEVLQSERDPQGGAKKTPSDLQSHPVGCQ
jgi:hypothetical protein